MPTVEKTVITVTCDSCDRAPNSDDEPETFDTLELAIACLTEFGADWEYFADTDRWVCDTCRAVEACHSAGGHVFGIWKDSFLDDGKRWRECLRIFDFGRCPGYEDRPIETARVREEAL